jgi:hypothetical protein
LFEARECANSRYQRGQEILRHLVRVTVENILPSPSLPGPFSVTPRLTISA